MIACHQLQQHIPDTWFDSIFVISMGGLYDGDVKNIINYAI